MIVVTGTKRSGTSMWMQVLRAARVPMLAQEFPAIWEDTIKGANRRGFFESFYRKGVFYQTNPHPITGHYLNAQKTSRVALKVFVPGLVRTEIAYLNRVIATVRPFRQYVASLNRLYEMEKESQLRTGQPEIISPHLDPLLEWWVENFLLIRDIVTRGYNARLVSYEAVVERPAEICNEIFEWLALDLEPHVVAEAISAVHPEDCTQLDGDESLSNHRHTETFDEFHRRIKEGTPIDAAFLSHINDTHQDLLPEIEEALDALASRHLGMGDERKRRSASLNPGRLDALLHPMHPMRPKVRGERRRDNE